LTLLAGGWVLRAQVNPGEPEPARPSLFADPNQRKLEDLLERSITVPFAQETPLHGVAAHLAQSLQVRVVLDPAAMARLALLPEDPIQLDIEGEVRLRTALPLLLDQLGLTYHFVPEDRLLVLTDAHGAGDPWRQVLDELRDLHRDVHDLQDAVEEIYQALAPPDDPEPGRLPPPDDARPPAPEKPPASRTRST
jgi:hypothetical protein